MSTLRTVLQHFERQPGTIALPVLARELGLEQAMLQEMIDYWVRKGRLREVFVTNCAACGSARGCPFVVAMPRCYELAAADAQAQIPEGTRTCICLDK
ncbi:MAG TPA: FeoC-like transcriptional regulator [Phototrophicaceae bacterium]|nr:FeoC-like transcriptional regulator [Phototrophicaceae bacterium]